MVEYKPLSVYMVNPEKKFFYKREMVLSLVETWRREGHRIGFTSGGFDLLHYGHVDYLTKARKLCGRLVVGVNSDESVRISKGPRRPLVGERDRVRIVASLEAVSCAFIFSEVNNQENILSIRPDFYFKGGDYRFKPLSSSVHLQSWGGKVKTLSFVKGHSTTGLIDRVLERYHDQLPQFTPLPLRSSPAIFLDRDGVINREVEYLHDPKEFSLLPGVLEGLQHFQKLGYRLIVVTNQAGIGLGYFSKEDFYRVNQKMMTLCRKKGIVFSKIYYCPHSLEEGCRCRKPGTLLLERAAAEAGVDLSRSVMIGDKTSDIACGQALGLATVLVATGHAGKDQEYSVVPDVRVRNLKEAARWVGRTFPDKQL